MTEATEHKVDRTGWKPGPWDQEGDRWEWRTKAGLPGLITRNRMGALCGYAAVPPGHPLHGQGYGENYDIDVHGRLTYSDRCAGHICHVPEPGEPDDVWWFGFDCMHSGDVVPHLASLDPGGLPDEHFATYKDEAYVRARVEHLAEQLQERTLAAAASRAWPEDGAP